MPLKQPQIERCDGAKSNTPEAELCRRCKRAEAGKSSGQSFIEPAVSMSRYFDFGPKCAFFVPLKD